jgi:hypothetical protein
VKISEATRKEDEIQTSKNQSSAAEPPSNDLNAKYVLSLTHLGEFHMLTKLI